MNVKINIPQESNRRPLFELLVKYGYAYDRRSRGYTKWEHFIDDVNTSDWPILGFNTETLSITSYAPTVETDYSWPLDCIKIIEELSPCPRFKLTKDYDAELTNDGIKVGCQLIPYDKFKELVEFVEVNR